MIEPRGPVALLSLLYGAGLVGALVALLTRAALRRRQVPTLFEAGWCVFLPLLSFLALPLLAATDPHLLHAFGGAHDLWHAWEAAVHCTPLTHALLHGANWAVLAAGGFFLVRTVYTLSRMRSFAVTLRRSAPLAAHSTVGETLCHLDSPRPLCFTGGWLRPAIFLTTGLREQLSERDLAAMLAHEAAHVRRRDPLLKAGLTLFYTLFPLPGSQRLLQDWNAAVERACDQEAARHVGSPYDVAAALVQVAQLVARQPLPLPYGTCFADAATDLEGRVEHLLQRPAPSIGKRWMTGVLVAVSLGLVLSADSWLPHAVELFAHH